MFLVQEPIELKRNSSYKSCEDNSAILLQINSKAMLKFAGAGGRLRPGGEGFVLHLLVWSQTSLLQFLGFLSHRMGFSVTYHRLTSAMPSVYSWLLNNCFCTSCQTLRETDECIEEVCSSRRKGRMYCLTSATMFLY